MKKQHIHSLSHLYNVANAYSHCVNVNVELDLSKVLLPLRKRVISSIKQGICLSNAGNTAYLYRIICSYYAVPYTLLHKGSYWEILNRPGKEENPELFRTVEEYIEADKTAQQVAGNTLRASWRRGTAVNHDAFQNTDRIRALFRHRAIDPNYINAAREAIASLLEGRIICLSYDGRR